MTDGPRYEQDLIEQATQVGGRAIADLEREALLLPERGVCLESLKIKLPQARHGEWLIVGNGRADDGTPMVAFMGGDSLSKALRRFTVQYDDGSLKWRIDQWRLDHA